MNGVAKCLAVIKKYNIDAEEVSFISTSLGGHRISMTADELAWTAARLELPPEGSWDEKSGAVGLFLDLDGVGLTATDWFPQDRSAINGK